MNNKYRVLSEELGDAALDIGTMANRFADEGNKDEQSYHAGIKNGVHKAKAAIDDVIKADMMHESAVISLTAYAESAEFLIMYFGDEDSDDATCTVPIAWFEGLIQKAKLVGESE